MAEAVEKILTWNGVEGKDLGCFIPHQANKRIILSTEERLGMPEESVIINIDRYGNTTAATIPMAMQTALEEKRLKKWDLVLLASVGAGVTVGATFLRWEVCKGGGRGYGVGRSELRSRERRAYFGALPY